MEDIFELYESGVENLLGLLGVEHSEYSNILTLQTRLLENLSGVSKYGDSEVSRSDRQRIIETLNQISQRALGISFSQILHPDRKDQLVSLGTRRIRLPSEAPISEITHNLPPRSEFIDRSSEKDDLLKALRSRSVLTVVTGIGGVGKTSLVLEICHQLVSHPELLEESHRFRYIIWISVGDERMVDVDVVFNTVVKVMNYPFILNLEPGLKRQESLNILRHNTSLIVLDDLSRDVSRNVLSFINDLPEPCKAIVTSRHRPTYGGWVKPLRGLSVEDTEQLIESELQTFETPIDKTELHKTGRDIFRVTEGAPLAIKWAIRQIGSRGLPIGVVIEQISSAQGDLFQFIFERSWAIINQQSRLILTCAALCPSPIPWMVAKEVIGDADTGDVNEALGSLVELWLLEPSSEIDEVRRHYRLHSLTRAFVVNRLQSLPQNEISQLKKLLSTIYLEYAKCHSDTWSNYHNLFELERQKDNLLEAIQWSYDLAKTEGKSEYWRQVIGFAEAIAPFLWARGFWNDRQHLCEWGLEGADCIGDNEARIRILNLLGRVYLWRGKLTEAQACASKITDCLQKPVVDKYYHMIASSLQAVIASYEGRSEHAEELLLDVLKTASPSDTTELGRAATLVDLGVTAYRRKDYKLAIQRLSEAFALDQETFSVEGQAVSASHLARSYLELDDFHSAKKYFSLSLQLAREVGRLSTMGRCQIGMAEISLREGEWNMAETLCNAAFDTFSRLGMQREIDYVRSLTNKIKSARSKANGV